MQYCRYAQLAQSLGAKVILEVEPALVDILRSMPGNYPVFTKGDELPAFDYQCPLMSLQIAFKTTIETIPTHTPYLFADQAKSAAWKDQISKSGKMKVGIVWSGGPRTESGAQEHLKGRNIDITHLAALVHKDIDFYSLQKGEAAELQLRDLTEEEWGGSKPIDLTHRIHDFSDTAALIDNLDLVICVDTAVAHLAGAMGKPVWMLNRHDGCWRWLIDRSDSPWYPSMKIYNQKTPMDWSEAISRVKEDLHALARRPINTA